LAGLSGALRAPLWARQYSLSGALGAAAGRIYLGQAT